MTSPPRLVAPDAGDYHLRASSPCIDSGTNAAWMNLALDVDGQPRIFNGAVDIGAAETYVAADGIAVSNGTILTEWLIPAGAACRLMSCTDLVSSAWTPVGPTFTGEQSRVIIDTGPQDDPASFFRLQWLRE